MNMVNDEVLAAISAAVASFDARSGYKLVVRSFRRTAQSESVWAAAGRIENVNNSLSFK